MFHFLNCCNTMKGILLLIVIATCKTQTIRSDCPPKDQLGACICRKGSNQKLTIDCSNVQSEEELSNDVKFEDQEIEELVIEASSLSIIPGVAFSPMKSRIISIRQNLNLRNIEVYAFEDVEDHIEILNMDGNKLDESTIFDIIATLKKLVIVNLKSNLITSIPDRAFAALPELVTINLSDNRITKLGREAFADCPKLRNVYLIDNKIDILPGRMLAQSIPLPVDQKEDLLIFLYRNVIDEFKADAFDGIRKPIQVDLTDNRIRILPKKVFQASLSNMSKKNDGSILILTGNPFTCDCRMRFLLENRDFFKIVTQMTCFDTNKLFESYSFEDPYMIC